MLCGMCWSSLTSVSACENVHVWYFMVNFTGVYAMSRVCVSHKIMYG